MSERVTNVATSFKKKDKCTVMLLIWFYNDRIYKYYTKPLVFI